MKKILNHKKIVVIVLSLLCFFAFLWFKNAQTTKTSTPSSTNKVVKTDLRIAFSIDGKLTIDTYESGFLINGKVSQVLVKEGDKVRRGQVIAKLDTQELGINLQQALNTLRDKQAIVEKIEDDVKDHATDETFAQKAIRTTAQTARDSASDEVNSAKRAFQDATITSPVDGVVAQLNLKAGDVVSTQNQSSSVIIIKPESLSFVAYAEEDDVLKIADDQILTLTLSAYNQEKFPAKLIFLSPLSTTDSNGLSSYKIIASIDNPNNLRLLDGMEASLSFITKEIKDVIAVANKAVYREDNQAYVDVKEADNHFQKTPVETGFTDGKSVEIISGLTLGQEVLLRN
jgi:RND family efflux transporter MFP subunit